MSEMMTAQELAEARELEQAATFGNRTIAELDRYLDDVADDGVSPDHEMSEWDAYHVIEDLLAEVKAARTLVPRLLDDNEELRRLLDQAYAAVEYADLEHDDERCANENPYLMCADCRSYAAGDV